MLTDTAAIEAGDVERDDTAALLAAAAAGDLVAFEQIVATHERLVYVTALRLLGNREDARDAAQEVFVRLYRHLARIDAARALSSWLYRVTVNVCRDIIRARPQTAPLDFDLPGAAPGPEAETGTAEHRRILEAGLRRLTPKERAAVVLRDIEGLSTREAARALGSTEVTVRSHLCAARMKLKKFVDAFKRGRV